MSNILKLSTEQTKNIYDRTALASRIYTRAVIDQVKWQSDTGHAFAIPPMVYNMMNSHTDDEVAVSVRRMYISNLLILARNPNGEREASALPNEKLLDKGWFANAMNIFVAEEAVIHGDI